MLVIPSSTRSTWSKRFGVGPMMLLSYKTKKLSWSYDKLISWEMILWLVDPMAIYLVRIDLVTPAGLITTESSDVTSMGSSVHAILHKPIFINKSTCSVKPQQSPFMSTLAYINNCKTMDGGDVSTRRIEYSSKCPHFCLKVVCKNGGAISGTCGVSPSKHPN